MKAVGIGTRVLTFIIDNLIIFILSFAAYKGWAFYAYYWGIIYFQFAYFFWAITFIYYLFFESIFKRTPGKWVSLTKVVNLNGGKPSFPQIFLRSLVRLLIIFDWLAFPFLNERALHDYLSKTEVVEI
jgi:uncharacterized RDD family membrane protein YckC